MKVICLYYEPMIEMSIKNLLNLLETNAVRTSKFIEDFRINTKDEPFRKLLSTMVDQERQFVVYMEENLGKLNMKSNFGSGISELFEFDTSIEEIPDVTGLSKVEFLKIAIRNQEFSISICDFLGNIAQTDTGLQVFKVLSAEKRRHLMIFKGRLDLEEMF